MKHLKIQTDGELLTAVTREAQSIVGRELRKEYEKSNPSTEGMVQLNARFQLVYIGLNGKRRINSFVDTDVVVRFGRSMEENISETQNQILTALSDKVLKKTHDSRIVDIELKSLEEVYRCDPSKSSPYLTGMGSHIW